MPEVDVFVSGAPCPPWSSAGKKLGLNDLKDRGILIYHSLSYVVQKRPSVAVFENVKGLSNKRNAHVLADIIKILKDCGYRVWRRVLDTCQNGIPHSRPRLYVVAVLRRQRGFHFPKPITCLPLSRFVVSGWKPPETARKLNAAAARNVRRVKKRFAKSNGAPVRDLVVDAGASKRFCTGMAGRSPCLTKSRSFGHYLCDENRYMNLHEMGALQGIPKLWVDSMATCQSETTIGQALGDAMSICTLMRLLPRALYSAGLIDALPRDIWEKGDESSGHLPDALYDKLRRTAG